MTTPQLKVDQADDIESLRRRVETLETALRATATSFSSGSFTFRDPTTGQALSILGRYSDGVDTFFGRADYDGAGNNLLMVRGDRTGFVHPDFSAPFTRDEWTAVTSGTFITIESFHPQRVYHDVLRVAVWVTSDASTVGEIRLHESISSTSTDPLVTTAGGNQIGVIEWLHGVPLSAGAAAFQLQARRVSGAGNINVHSIYESSLLSSAHAPDAAADGSPSF